MKLFIRALDRGITFDSMFEMRQVTEKENFDTNLDGSPDPEPGQVTPYLSGFPCLFPGSGKIPPFKDTELYNNPYFSKNMRIFSVIKH